MQTTVTTGFADGEYRFALMLPQLFEFERDAIPLVQFEQSLRDGIGQDAAGNFVFIGGGNVNAKAILDLIRLGLVGGNGGMVQGVEVEVGPLRARDLVAAYAYPARPLGEAAALAYHIAHATIHGIELKKKEAEPASDQADLTKAS